MTTNKTQKSASAAANAKNVQIGNATVDVPDNAAAVPPAVARVARRKMNLNIQVDAEIIPMPPKEPKSKYPFEMLDFKNKSFLIPDCTVGNAAAIKTTGKKKFGMKLRALPVGDGYRFWRTDGPELPEAENEEAKQHDAAKENEDA
jgi:hypothetical protein